MKKFATKFTAFAATILLLLGLGGCGFIQNVQGDRIATPEVVICYDGSVVWSPVENANYYIYVIDEGKEIATADCAANEKLEEGQSVRVKAVGSDDESEFSAPQTYHKETVDPNHVHSDVDGDGLGEQGGEKVTIDLSIYAVNDLHGKFKDSSSQPGLDEFTTYMKELYADPAREEILISSGDMWQGSVESSSNKGQLMTEWMNEVGFSSMTLGNHEYDWGSAVLTPNSKLAKYPFLANNVRENGDMPAYCKASTVVEKGGVKVGIIGAIGDCLSSISGEFSGGLEFETDSVLTALVKNEATRLRNEEGCDFIVYSIHDGGSGYSSSGINEVSSSQLSVKDGNKTYNYYDTSLSDGYVDLVFEGHTHQRYILKDKFGVYHLQGGGENSGVSRAEVSFNTITKEYSVTPTILATSVYANNKLEDDPFIEESYLSYFPDPDEDPYTKVLGSNRSRRDEDSIVQKVAELYLERGKKEWLGKTVGGKTIDKIVLGGGYLSTRKPYDLSAGNIHYADLYSILPFDNHIVLGSISGSNLKKRFFESSSYVYSADITSSEIIESATYYIIVDTFSSYYHWNGITEIARIGGDVYARDLLAEFIQGGGWA